MQNKGWGVRGSGGNDDVGSDGDGNAAGGRSVWWLVVVMVVMDRVLVPWPGRPGTTEGANSRNCQGH